MQDFLIFFCTYFQSRPFLRDRKKFVQIVDPNLQGRFPLRCLHHAIAITAMCIQEQPHFRPLIGDIVVALEYLATLSSTPESHEGTCCAPQQSQPQLDSNAKSITKMSPSSV